MTELNTAIFLMFNGLVGQSVIFDWTIVFLADYLAYLLVIASVISLLLWKTDWVTKKSALLAAVLSTVISRGIFVELIRIVYPHPRPSVTLSSVLQLLTETSSSFPSGHAAFFFALSSVTYHYNRKLGLIVFTASVMMGLARIIAGVHYPLDILGGAILGLCIGFITSLVVDKFYRKM